MMLLENQNRRWSSVVGRWPLSVRFVGRPSVAIWLLANDARPTTNDRFLRRYRRRFSSRLCSHRRRGRGHLLLRVLDSLDLVEALLLLINAHAEELDHRLGHTQAALQFVHQSAAAFKREQNEKTVVEPADDICQPPLAHFFDTLHRSA